MQIKNTELFSSELWDAETFRTDFLSEYRRAELLNSKAEKNWVISIDSAVNRTLKQIKQKLKFILVNPFGRDPNLIYFCVWGQSRAITEKKS